MIIDMNCCFYNEKSIEILKINKQLENMKLMISVKFLLQ